MAEEGVDSDYAGRPIEQIADEAQDRSGPFLGDCCSVELDGRWVWSCPDGTFESDAVTGGPDRSRPVDHEWPTLEQLLAEAADQ